MVIRFAAMVSLLSVVLSLGGCIVVHADGHGDGDVSSVLGSINVDYGARRGNLKAVNGSIDIRDDASAERVSTVNGSLSLGDDVQVYSLETVNGSIRAGSGLRVRDDVETINGVVRLRKNTVVGETVSTVNGDIDLYGVQVGRDLETVNGDVSLEGSTTVEGDVVFKERSRWWRREGRPPRLNVDASSAVRGDIILYSPVDLDIDEDAQVGEVIRRYEERD